MTGSLRLSALLLLLLSRWASADLEKGEDEYVRSWVIIEEQLVPPSRDEPLATGGVGTAGGGVGGGAAGRRITPKSVFVAPSFNKCSDGYRPDSMGRCVKVVKINQAAQWDFLIKQLNSMYVAGAGGGGFPMLPGASAYQPATTTTTDLPSQKTDSPGPFQLNIPLGGGMVGDVDSSYNQTMDSLDELTTGTTTTAGITTTTNPTTTTTTTAAAVSTTVADDEDEDTATTDHPVTTNGDLDDRTAVTVTATAVTTDPADTARPRPYRNRYQTTHAEDISTVTPPSYDLTTTVTYAKTKYVDSSKTTIAGTEDSPQTFKTTASALPSSSISSPVVTTTAVDVTETDNPVTATTPPENEEEEVVTVLAVAAAAAVNGDGGSGKPVSTTRLPYTTGGRTQSPVMDTVTPEYYDDQPEEPTSSPEPDCSAPNAYRYYAVCASIRQQQQFEQLQQQQQLLHQQQQLYQQQQQQFYHQQQQQNNHMATALVKRPAAGGGGVQVRFPGDEDPASVTVQADSVNLIRFPGPAPYRTTNKMYESSRHPTWWPTGWPDQQQQQQQQRQQQQSDDSVLQQHRLQHHLPQQKQDVRLWEFGSRLPKTTSTTTVAPPPPTQWYHRFF